MVENNEFNDNKKGKPIFRIIILFVWLIIVIGFVAFYLIVVLNPKALLFNGIKKSGTYFEELIEPLNPHFEVGENFTFSNIISAKLETNLLDESVLDLINNSTINTDISYSMEQKKALFALKANINSTEFKADYYVDNVENYVNLYDMYDKYIKIGDLGYDIFAYNNLEEEEINYMLDVLKDSIKTRLDSKYFTREFSMNKTPSVTSKLTLNKEQFAKLLDDIKNDIVSDDKAVQIMKKVITDEEIKQLSDEHITSADFSFNELTLIVEQAIFENSLKKVEYILDDENVVMVKDKENVKLTFKEKDNTTVMDIVKNKEGFVLTSDNINIEGKKDGEYYSYSLDFKLNNTLDDMYNYNDTDISINQMANFEDNDTLDDVTNINMTYKFRYENTDVFKCDNIFLIKYGEDFISIINNGNISDTTNINVNPTNNIPLDNMSEDDVNTIYSNFINKITSIINSINL